MARIIAIAPIFLLILSIPIFIGVYVWKDAHRRHMNAPLWTLIAVLAPSLIGFIIYLLVRSDHSDLRCSVCGAVVTEDYAVCPNCGRALRSVCPGCGTTVQPGWKVCPYCASPLSDVQTDITPPVRPVDRALWKILAVVIITPILVMMFGLVLFTVNTGSGSTDMSSMSVGDYFDYVDRPHVEEWFHSLEANADTAYALRYVSGSRTQYLVYVPAASENISTTFGVRSGLFGGPNICLELENDHGNWGDTFYLLAYRGDKVAGLRVELDGKKLDCHITEADFDPALWVMGEDD